jgi:hypothetical protein
LQFFIVRGKKIKQYMKIQIIALVMLTGCASKIIVDPKSSTNPANYYADKIECESISENVSYGEEMAKGAAIQGIASALFTAWLASKSHSVQVKTAAQAGAASGGAVGAGSGAYSVFKRREAIVRQCLAARGYKILE